MAKLAEDEGSKLFDRHYSIARPGHKRGGLRGVFCNSGDPSVTSETEPEPEVGLEFSRRKVQLFKTTVLKFQLDLTSPEFSHCISIVHTQNKLQGIRLLVPSMSKLVPSTELVPQMYVVKHAIRHFQCGQSGLTV